MNFVMFNYYVKLRFQNMIGDILDNVNAKIKIIQKL